MKYRLYKDIHTFYNDTYDILMRHEAQNLIPLGNVILGNEGKDKRDWRDPANWLMATVSDEAGIRLTAIMTPPHNLTLYATDNVLNEEAISCLIAELAEQEVPGVMTEKTLAEYFADAYSARKGISFTTSMNQRIFELTTVKPDIPKLGTLRLLTEKDMSFFPYWAEAFYAAAVRYDAKEMSIPQEAERFLFTIATEKIYVLEDDGVPVSIAGLVREMPTSAGVAMVYTPPYNRGKGYATSCVAGISQIALDKGFLRCVLYTDLANPTSNSIYQKIGYRPICDSLEIKFE